MLLVGEMGGRPLAGWAHVWASVTLLFHEGLPRPSVRIWKAAARELWLDEILDGTGSRAAVAAADCSDCGSTLLLIALRQPAL